MQFVTSVKQLEHQSYSKTTPPLESVPEVLGGLPWVTQRTEIQNHPTGDYLKDSAALSFPLLFLSYFPCGNHSRGAPLLITVLVVIQRFAKASPSESHSYCISRIILISFLSTNLNKFEPISLSLSPFTQQSVARQPSLGCKTPYYPQWTPI